MGAVISQADNFPGFVDWVESVSDTDLQKALDEVEGEKK